MLESSLPSLPPTEASLALLSFLRDELPVGGASAERRFVELFPSLMGRVCGALVAEESVVASTTAAASGSATPTNSHTGTVTTTKTYHHSPDAWLSLPAPSQDHHPVLRLLCAPRCVSLDGTTITTNNNNNNGAARDPSLLDAIAVESRVLINDYPADCLEKELVELWRLCQNSVGHSHTANGHGGTGSATFGKSSLGIKSAMRMNNTPASKNTTRATALLEGKESTIQLIQMLPPQPMLQPTMTTTSIHSPKSTNMSPLFGKSFHGGSPLTSPRGNSPSLSLTQSPSSGASIKKKDEETKILLQLTMFQYYFFMFLRFPLMERRQHQPPPTTTTGNVNYGRSTVTIAPPNRGSLYGHLFHGYLRYYLPVPLSPNDDININVNIHSKDDTTMHHPNSRLFLHLLIHFWLLHNSIPTTSTSLKYIRDSTLRDCLELSRLEGGRQFQTLPSKIQNGIMATVRHLMGDGNLKERVQRVSGMIQACQREERAGSAAAATTTTTSPSSPTQEKSNHVVWCLSPAMSTLQQSLLNYIRVGLACGSIHNKDSSFHRSLEIWLMWIEPWNFTIRKRMRTITSSSSSSPGHNTTPRDLLRVAANAAQHKNMEYYSHYTRPRATSKSLYNNQWEGYVVSNLHFYVLPLAIFLKRARELEFSSASAYPKSLALVQRVLRCYPQSIVNVLNGVLNSRADAVTNGIVSKHIELLGAYAPPEGWKLSSCQVDAMNLLEEMFGQYEKRVRERNCLERWEANIEALFTGSMQREEGALKVVLGQLKCLVGLPLEYTVPTEFGPEQRGWMSRFFGKGAIGAMEDTVGPERTPDGLLTDLGRQQLAAGTRQCSPFDVHYIGDPMLAPYQSHEVPALVDVAIAASNYLNDRLGFVPLSTLVRGKEDEDMLTKNIREMERYNKIVFRINLRFLADYRNVLAVSFVVWIVRKFS